MADTYLGDFALNGAMLRRKGINRIGNLLVPNDVRARARQAGLMAQFDCGHSVVDYWLSMGLCGLNAGVVL